eukprot:gene7223-8031_t
MENKKRSSSRRLQGLLLMATAGLYLTLANAFVKFVYKTGHTSLSPCTLMFFRSLITFILNSVFMIIGRVKPLDNWKSMPILSLMGVAATGQVLFLLLSLERISLADATVIQFTAPVFTMSLSFVLLGVSCVLFDTICGIVSFIGVAIITKPDLIFGTAKKECPSNLIQGELSTKPDENDYLYGIILALLSSFSVSIFYVLNKILGKNLDLTIMIFYPSLFGIFIAPIAAFGLGEPLSPHWSWASVTAILLVGLLSFVHLLFVAESLQLEDAGPASLVRNADIVYAFVLQFLFLGEKPEWTTLLGASLIITTTSMIAVKRILNTETPNTVKQ